MGTSDITVDDLTAIDDVHGIKLAWTYSDPRSAALFNVALDMVEVWASSTNDRTAAAKVGEGIVDYSHAGLARGDVRYYWIKARNNLGSYGDWHPASSTAGVVGTELSGDVLIAADGYWKHPSGLIEQWGTVNISDSTQPTVITFPIAFPNQCFQVVGTPTNNPNTGAGAQTLTVESFTTTTADVLGKIVANAGTVSFVDMNASWRALGY